MSSGRDKQVCAIFSRKLYLQMTAEWWQPENFSHHSHSIVAGGFPEMSYVTREMPGTSLMMRRDT